MGMHLKPIKPSKNAPRNKLYWAVIWGGYKYAEWSSLRMILNKWGVDTSEFSSLNDGKIISNKTCKKVAKAIKDNIESLEQSDQEWLYPHIKLWNTCGGYEQW